MRSRHSSVRVLITSRQSPEKSLLGNARKPLKGLLNSVPGQKVLLSTVKSALISLLETFPVKSCRYSVLSGCGSMFGLCR